MLKALVYINTARCFEMLTYDFETLLCTMLNAFLLSCNKILKVILDLSERGLGGGRVGGEQSE